MRKGDSPGPGQYKADEAYKKLDNKDKSLAPQSAVFAMTKVYDKGSESPAVGSYNPIRYDDIGVKDVLSGVKSTSKKELHQKLSKRTIQNAQGGHLSTKLFTQADQEQISKTLTQQRKKGSMTSMDREYITSRLGGSPKTMNKMIEGIMDSFIGPGYYNTHDEQVKKQQILEKHLYPSQIAKSVAKHERKKMPLYMSVSQEKTLVRNSSDILTKAKTGSQAGLAKVGTNFVGNIPKPAEFYEQDQYNQLKNQGVDQSIRGPGSYLSVKDWAADAKKKTFNLKIIKENLS